MSFLRLDVVALWLIYAAAAAAALWLSRRFVATFPKRAGVFLALAPLVFSGKAMLLGQFYGPADLYYGHEPWKRVAAEHGVVKLDNPILSDLAFANIPWRAAVRDALVNGRLPFWNRFVLGGNPLLGTAQAGILHPSTWLAIFLPVALSWTFSCTFTIFLALLCGFLFFLDFRLTPLPALVGAAGWGFSTYVLFWDGWSVGPAVASFPLLLLGLRRIARGESRGVGLSVIALLLSLAGGHPETLFHCAAAGGVYFLWELFGGPATASRGFRSALVAGILAFLLAGPQLFPLLEAIRHSAEYRARRNATESKHSQSVGAAEAARRLLPAMLPFSHGIYGQSPVQAERHDGSGMPLAYAGAMLFAPALYGLSRRRGQRVERGRSVFVTFLVAGLLLGASAPGLIDIVTMLPGFSMALNYRLVFLAPLGLAGLAALGLQRVCDEESWKGLGVVGAGVFTLLLAAFFFSRGVFAERALPEEFLRAGLARELVPVGALAAGAFLLSRDHRVLLTAALLLLVIQRVGEMGGVYPTWPAATLAPTMPELSALPAGPPWRIVAPGDIFRPNGAALYGLEDVRGYESLVLDRFADTYPLWSQSQFASFNRVDDLGKPFLSFLNVRFAVAPPGTPAPPGWTERRRGGEMSVFENTRVLPRAFAPTGIRFEGDPQTTLREMAAATDFSEVAWVRTTGEGRAAPSRRDDGSAANGPADVGVREIGPDVVVRVFAPRRVFIATSLPDWPGWIAQSESGRIPLSTVNHAFAGFWIGPGRHVVRLRYQPASFLPGVVSFVAGLAVAAVLGRRTRRSTVRDRRP